MVYENIGRSLEVILKVAERCNINCSYCYFFESQEKTYKEHSKIISPSTAQALIDFLQEGVADRGIQRLAIDLHGGEPLLMKKNAFDDFCGKLHQAFGDIDLELNLQTNGVLVDEEWIRLFEKHKVSASVSLDGPAAVNDRYRKDFKGRGTHADTVRGLGLMRAAADNQRISHPGLLCVVNPEADPIELYEHFVNENGIRTMDLLLPDYTHDNLPDDFSVEKLAGFMVRFFDAWFDADNPDVYIRVFHSVVSMLMGGPSHVVGYGDSYPDVITVSSDGHIGTDDTIRVCGVKYLGNRQKVNETSLSDFLAGQEQQNFSAALSDISAECRNCCWFKVCGGGYVVHRFKDGSFANPSIYCEALKKMYAHIATRLLERGLNLEELMQNLELEEPDLLKVN